MNSDAFNKRTMSYCILEVIKFGLLAKLGRAKMYVKLNVSCKC